MSERERCRHVRPDGSRCRQHIGIGPDGLCPAHDPARAGRQRQPRRVDGTVFRGFGAALEVAERELRTRAARCRGRFEPAGAEQAEAVADRLAELRQKIEEAAR